MVVDKTSTSCVVIKMSGIKWKLNPQQSVRIVCSTMFFSDQQKLKKYSTHVFEGIEAPGDTILNILIQILLKQLMP